MTIWFTVLRNVRPVPRLLAAWPRPVLNSSPVLHHNWCGLLTYMRNARDDQRRDALAILFLRNTTALSGLTVSILVGWHPPSRPNYSRALRNHLQITRAMCGVRHHDTCRQVYLVYQVPLRLLSDYLQRRYLIGPTPTGLLTQPWVSENRSSLAVIFLRTAVDQE